MDVNEEFFLGGWVGGGGGVGSEWGGVWVRGGGGLGLGGQGGCVNGELKFWAKFQKKKFDGGGGGGGEGGGVDVNEELKFL